MLTDTHTELLSARRDSHDPDFLLFSFSLLSYLSSPDHASRFRVTAKISLAVTSV